MSKFEQLLSDIEIPKFVPVHNELDKSYIEDIPAEVHRQLLRKGTLDLIKPGESVCLTGSSRDVANQASILKALVDEFKAVGAKPFIIPAMGSHAGAEAKGQAGILEGYGITEETMGCPIKASMETDPIAVSDDGLTIYMDRYANAADHICAFGRIKAHTDFRGAVESGICKMIVIGLGKQQGAYQCHAMGFNNMAKNVLAFAKKILEKKTNIFGFATIENAYHDTCRLVALPHDRIVEEEPELLVYAKSKMAKLPFKNADILFVDEIGKDISGSGMDPNVTGRSPILGISEPNFQRIACMGITDVSHGNFSGLGNADVTTGKVYEKIDFEQTYPNGITAAEPVSQKIPVVMDSDRTAMKFAIRTATDIDRKVGPKIVWIKNTLKVVDFYVSEAMVPDVLAIDSMSVAGEAFEVPFKEDGYVDVNALPELPSDHK